MVITIIAFVHLFAAICLVVFVLLQDSKGGAAGIFGGGSSKSVFGSTGGVSFLARLTTGFAIVFSLTCISLAYLTSTSYQHGGSVFDNAASKPAAPMQTAPAPVTAPETTAPPQSAPAATEPSNKK